MKNFGFSLLAFALLTCGLARTTWADDDRPNIFTFAYQGFLVGAGAGLAGGYLVAHEGGLHASDWKPLVYGTGIGALAGIGVGLTLGIIDAAQDKPGRTRYVLRDMGYGEGLGAVVGLIAGGLTALSTRNTEHLLFGASIGVLSGAAVGALFGVIEGGHSRAQASRDNGRFALSLVPVAEAGGKFTYLPALSGRY